RRLTRALVYFKASCAKSKRRRQLKTALRIVHDLSHRRPLEQRWFHWQAIVREARVKAAFLAWAKAGRRERRIRIAARVLRANKETTAVVGVWNTWRRAAGASKLTRLLGAWAVIGPARRALEAIQTSAKQARADQWQRAQLLRRGLRCGFTTPTMNRRQMRAVASRAQSHNRKRGIRRAQHGNLNPRISSRFASHRWFVRHRSNVLLAVFRRRLETFRRLASIKEWARKAGGETRMLAERTKRHSLASCVGRFEENALRRRASHQSSAAATAKWRRSRLGHGFMCWYSRGRALQRQQRSQGVASSCHRLSSLRRGLVCVLAFTEKQTHARSVIRAKATSSNQARGLSLAISSLRLSAARFQGQRDLARAADLHFRRRFFAVSLALWRRRVDRVSGAELTVQRFQRQYKLRLGLAGLRRWSEKRGLARLATWRAQLWAEAFCATCALRKWRKHAESTGDLAASFRIAEGRRLKSEIARRRCSSPLAKHIFGALHGHARARQLKRCLFKAWLDHTQTLTRARKQARSFCVRSGLRGLRSWAKLSQYLRERRLLALNHSNRRVTESIFRAWKNAVFPLGLRAQWGPRASVHRDGEPAQDEGARLRLSNTSKAKNAVTEVECLGLTEATANNQHDGRSPSLKHDSLVLLRLPMIGQRMRRVLHAWRKLAKKGKRLNYIRDMLPHKVSVR
ncbi:unnamed protein product, partial [Laminaria digitata]